MRKNTPTLDEFGEEQGESEGLSASALATLKTWTSPRKNRTQEREEAEAFARRLSAEQLSTRR